MFNSYKITGSNSGKNLKDPQDIYIKEQHPKITKISGSFNKYVYVLLRYNEPSLQPE